MQEKEVKITGNKDMQVATVTCKKQATWEKQQCNWDLRETDNLWETKLQIASKKVAVARHISTFARNSIN